MAHSPSSPEQPLHRLGGGGALVKVRAKNFLEAMRPPAAAAPRGWPGYRSCRRRHWRRPRRRSSRSDAIADASRLAARHLCFGRRPFASSRQMVIVAGDVGAVRLDAGAIGRLTLFEPGDAAHELCHGFAGQGHRIGDGARFARLLLAGEAEIDQFLGDELGRRQKSSSARIAASSGSCGDMLFHLSGAGDRAGLVVQDRGAAACLNINAVANPGKREAAQVERAPLLQVRRGDVVATPLLLEIQQRLWRRPGSAAARPPARLWECRLPRTAGRPVRPAARHRRRRPPRTAPAPCAGYCRAPAGRPAQPVHPAVAASGHAWHRLRKDRVARSRFR